MDADFNVIAPWVPKSQLPPGVVRRHRVAKRELNPQHRNPCEVINIRQGHQVGIRPRGAFTVHANADRSLLADVHLFGAKGYGFGLMGFLNLKRNFIEREPPVNTRGEGVLVGCHTDTTSGLLNANCLTKCTAFLPHFDAVPALRTRTIPCC